MKIIQKKNNCVDVLVYPVLVQGPGAPQQIADAIRDLSENYPDVDTIITGRGGGSMEELWAFNEEIVARSIYESKIPVISAVQAMKRILLSLILWQICVRKRRRLQRILLCRIPALIHEDLEFYRKEMMRSLELLVEKKKRRMALCSMENFERDIRGRIAMEQMRIDHMAEQMKQQLLAKEENCRSRLELLRETVKAADPNRILQKGYTILRDEEGNVILDVAALRKDQDVSLEGAGGFAEAKVVSARKKAGKKAEKR